MQPRSGGSRTLLTIFVLVAAAILLIIGLTGRAAPTSGLLSYVIAPVQGVASAISRAVSDIARGNDSAQFSRERLALLEEQVAGLAAENMRLREFQAEVTQYRDLLNFSRANPTYNVIGADVIGVGDKRCESETRPQYELGVCANAIAGEPSPYMRYLTLNVGEKDGVKTGMPVVGGGLGLVGRIGLVSAATSQVQLMIDTASFVNVTTIEGRASGSVTGKSDGSLVLQNVPQTDQLKVNDQLVTSGMGGTLPRLLPVGTVAQITSNDSQLFKEAIVRPAVNFNRIEQVLVIAAQK